jgi:hypothetical protein
MILMRSLRANNVHCVMILEGTDLIDGPIIKVKRLKWAEFAYFLGIITVWYLILRTMKFNVSRCVFVQPTM